MFSSNFTRTRFFYYHNLLFMDISTKTSRFFSFFLKTISLFIVLIVYFMQFILSNAFAFDSGNITAGGYHTCGLKDDGTAVCWGNNAY